MDVMENRLAVRETRTVHMDGTPGTVYGVSLGTIGRIAV